MIKESAHRHGIDDDDIEHARRHWVKSFDVVDDRDRHVTILIGPACSGMLLEIGVNSQDDIIHAMPARTRFLPKDTR
ncbi:MAG: hypothetical protein FWF43_04260 [Propionibacteriaceae bacterium]|nr:hypothetical protein [Propionibacteriaceae bacterium]